MSRRAGAALLTLGVGACAYFNGVYNARAADGRGDRLLRSGREQDAAAPFAEAAAKAESVLAHHPRTRWRSDAIYLAGRGLAYSGQCGRAVARLEEYLALPAQPAARRARAAIALGACKHGEAKYSQALALLDPLTRSSDRELAGQASLWALRSAMALGDDETAGRYLPSMDVGDAQWELATIALGAQEYARAESLLALRAQEGDFRDALSVAVRDLWSAGRHDEVERLVWRWHAARGRETEKARLHLQAGDLALAADEDSLAHLHLLAARRLATSDPLTRAEASSRLTLLQLRTQRALPLVDDLVARGAETAAGTSLQTRLEESLQLVHLLDTIPDTSGAALFLAAEVARDSLRAPLLAHALFKRIEVEWPTSVLAPKALLAAAMLLPDSADAYRGRVLGRYAGSPFALMLAGGDPSGQPQFRQAEELLRGQWLAALEALASRRALPDSAAAAAGVAARTPPDSTTRPATP